MDTMYLYTNPLIYIILTRFLINEKPIEEDEFIEHVIELDKYKDKVQLTFELCTAIAFRSFAQHNSDWNIIEVGLGGLKDAVNVDYRFKAQS